VEPPKDGIACLLALVGFFGEFFEILCPALDVGRAEKAL
jgi:hypothetical protein